MADYTKEERQRLLGLRMESESLASSRITNEDLICKDCRFKLEESEEPRITVSQCRRYTMKPADVFRGKCDEYEKGDSVEPLDKQKLKQKGGRNVK